MASIPLLRGRTAVADDMAACVLAGLARRPKQLPSRYLYDQRGAELFERICELDEYYVTRIETAILSAALPAIAARVGKRALVFEPGSGAGQKTRLLLSQLHSPAAYVPIDISQEQLFRNARRLVREFPQIDIVPVSADFQAAFRLPLVARRVDRGLAFFPGSTIGNLLPAEAIRLLRRLRHHCGRDGLILLGADLQKEVGVLERAYDDSAGISAAFALNYLVRLNRELGATFDLTRFYYRARYDARLGRIEMALVSRGAQSVSVAGQTIEFRAGEQMRTEVSYKYTPASLAALAAEADLQIDRMWTDRRGYFGVFLLSPRRTAC